MQCTGFDAVADKDARVLILGTLPGAESLRQGEYYALRHNSFWWIMGELVGAFPELPYTERLAQLKRHGIALWDVCHSALRPGSLDSNIAPDSIIANDFAGFFAPHKEVAHIFFNGQKANELFRRKVTSLPARAAAIPHTVLPSTSPARANITRAQKLEQWRKALGEYIVR
ncbi:MAG TPA: DNA-deoxyinosine glycosylase [Rickettsiales bacterium]|nr:DNA-deoxyinosine glycosylase [Rickettsiales bacterium]